MTKKELKKELKEAKQIVSDILDKWGITDELLAGIPSLDEMQRQADEEKKLNA